MGRMDEYRERLVVLGHYGRYLLSRVLRDDVLGTAAALSYTSLLALVPLMALSIAVMGAFPVFDAVRQDLQQFIFDNFVPAVGTAVQQHLSEFVGATGKLTAVGVVGLAVSAMLMLFTMEGAFNRIFRVTRARPIIGRILVYWTILTLGPLLLGTSFTVASWVTAGGLEGDNGGPFAWLSGLVPYVLTLAAFALLYTAVPNRRVRVRDALIGAVVAALLFAALRFGFIFYMSNFRIYQTIYGAVAAVPLFLIWMFLSWLVVLTGAVLTASLPEYRMRLTGVEPNAPKARLTLALDLLHLLAERQASGFGLTRSRLLTLTGAPEGRLVDLLDQLGAARFTARTDDGGYVLVRPLREARLVDLTQALGLGLPEVPDPGDRPWKEPLRQHLDAARAAEHDALDVRLDRVLLPRDDEKPG